VRTHYKLHGRERMMEGTYMIQVVEDGAVSFSRKYDNALEAVHAYDRFIDFGFAKWQREIVLVEPSGKAHSKSFDGPLGKQLQVK
jgi:hypothetical protein